VSALREVSKSVVLYAELPYTQHAFDVLPSVRSAHGVAAVVRFLEGVRFRRSLGPPAQDADTPFDAVPGGADPATSGPRTRESNHYP